MLRALPRSIFSWNFNVYLDRELIVAIDMRWFGEGGSFEYGGRRFDLRKAGVFSGEFSLEENGRVIAEATKTTMVRMFTIRWAGESYTLRALSPLTRRFVIEQQGEVVGGIGPDHPFTRKSSIQLPGGMPAEVGVFMFWLVALMWRRSQNSAAAS